MDGLIRKLEAAGEGSRELDAEIAAATFKTAYTGDDLVYAKLPTKDDGCATGTFWIKSRSGASLHAAPHYTTSLDAALTLMPEGDYGWEINKASRCDCEFEKACASVVDQDIRFERNGKKNNGDAWIECIGATPAIAVCLAILKTRARDATHGRPHGGAGGEQAQGDDGQEVTHD